MPETARDRFTSTLNALDKEYERIWKSGVKTSQEAVKALRDKIAVIISTGPELSAENLDRIKDSIELAVSNYSDNFTNAIQSEQENAWNNGLDIIDSSLTQLGIGAIGGVSRAQLLVATSLSADLITGISADTLTSINTALSTGIINGESVPQIMKNINNTLTKMPVSVDGAGRRYSTLYRSEMIARTEVSRAHTLASLQRLEQAKESVPNLKVEWVSEPDRCEKCAPFDGHIYDIDKLPETPPVHPNCRCLLVPFIPEE